MSEGCKQFRVMNTSEWQATHKHHGYPSRVLNEYQPPRGTYQIWTLICPCGSRHVVTEIPKSGDKLMDNPGNALSGGKEDSVNKEKDTSHSTSRVDKDNSLKADLAEKVVQIVWMCVDFDGEGGVRIDRAKALRLVSNALPQWQPIETCPKNGLNFLACSPASSVFFAHWANGVVDSSDYYEDWGYMGRHATLWMPLPPNPSTQDSGGFPATTAPDHGQASEPKCTCFAGPSGEHSTYCPRVGMDYDSPDSDLVHPVRDEKRGREQLAAELLGHLDRCTSTTAAYHLVKGLCLIELGREPNTLGAVVDENEAHNS